MALLLTACAPEADVHLIQPSCVLFCAVFNSHNEGPTIGEGKLK